MRMRLLPLLILLVATACSAANPATPSAVPANAPSATPGSGYQTLTMDAFADILATKHDQYTVVNVHIPYEGEIEGTNLKIPYNDVNALMTALPDKNAPIILYCRSGRMSEIAAKALVEKGYTRIFDVPGGMIKWEETGRKVIQK